MATLTYTLTESITLNGQDHGGSMTGTISSIDTIYKRIVNCPDTGSNDTTVLAQFEATVGDDADATGFDVGHVKYIRISNLDASNAVYLEVVGGNSGAQSYSQKLEAGKHFIVGSPDDAFVAEGDNDPTQSGWGDILSIAAYNGSGSSVQVEVLIASVYS